MPGQRFGVGAVDLDVGLAVADLVLALRRRLRGRQVGAARRISDVDGLAASSAPDRRSQRVDRARASSRDAPTRATMRRAPSIGWLTVAEDRCGRVERRAAGPPARRPSPRARSRPCRRVAPARATSASSSCVAGHRCRASSAGDSTPSSMRRRVPRIGAVVAIGLADHVARDLERDRLAQRLGQADAGRAAVRISDRRR